MISSMSDAIKKISALIISRDETILQCLRMLNDSESNILICLDTDRLVGIVTDHDIRQGILSGVRLEDKVDLVLNRNPITVNPDLSKEAVLALMKEKKADSVLVVDETGRFLKLHTLSEILESLTLPNSAIIVAGGFGKRLMPITQNMPKPLVKIGDKPIIEHVIRHVAKHGIESFFITVNHRSEMIRDYLKDGQDLGVNITYLEEQKQLGTVGAISLLKDQTIEFPFIVMNGDILTRMNFRKLLEQHKKSATLLTVCLTNFQYDVPYGVIEIHDGRIVGINEKPVHSFNINAGIYCMSPELIQLIPEDTYHDINTVMNLLFAKKIPIGYFRIDEYWRDVGNPEEYFYANRDYQNGALSL